MFVRDKRDRAITCMLCRDLHLGLMFCGFYKKICLKESDVWRKVISNKIVVTVCRLLSSPVLLRKFTIEKNTGFSICTRSDLNKNREETIKKHDLMDGSNHAKRTKNGHLEMVPVFQFFTHFSGLSIRRTKTGT